MKKESNHDLKLLKRGEIVTSAFIVIAVISGIVFLFCFVIKNISILKRDLNVNVDDKLKVTVISKTDLEKVNLDFSIYSKRNGYKIEQVTIDKLCKNTPKEIHLKSIKNDKIVKLRIRYITSLTSSERILQNFEIATICLVIIFLFMSLISKEIRIFLSQK